MAYHNQHNHHQLSQEQQMALQQHFTHQAAAAAAAAAAASAPSSLFRTIPPPDSAAPPHIPKGNQQQQQQLQQQLGGAGGPNWLSNALLQSQYGGGGPESPVQGSQGAAGHSRGTDFLNLHSSNPDLAATSGQSWLQSRMIDNPVLAMLPPPPTHESARRSSVSGETNSNNENSTSNQSGIKAELTDVAGGGDSGEGGGGEAAGGGGEGAVNWQDAKYKADVLGHPLYDQLLSAHVACLRIATPVDQLPRIDYQLAQSQQGVAKYSEIGNGAGNSSTVGEDKEELDQFMTHYVLLLCSFKEQLQQHVRVHAMEAVMACWEIEQSLQSLTGVSPGEGTGATMSDDDGDPVDIDMILYDGGLDGADAMGFGPLIPTESERTLMERVRQELKHELKQGYKEKIIDIREEILRKRRAGKLPGDTTSVLKAWWQSHSKWPYPTEEDKARLVRETGLQLKQINNWFINQRKRNWHSNPSGSTVVKSKRKRCKQQ